MKTFVKTSLILLVAVFLALPAFGVPCEEYPDFWCDYECYYYGGGWGWFCALPSSRCCWESPTGNVCGDSSSCPECDGCESLGGF